MQKRNSDYVLSNQIKSEIANNGIAQLRNNIKT